MSARVPTTISLWVRSADNVGFPYTKLPAYSVIPLIPLFFYARLWTLIFAFVSMFIIWRMHSKGYNLLWIYNRFKTALHGGRLSARPIWHIRRFSHLSDVVRDYSTRDK